MGYRSWRGVMWNLVFFYFLMKKNVKYITS